MNRKYRYLTTLFLILSISTLLWIFFFKTNSFDYYVYCGYSQSYNNSSLREMYYNNNIEYPPLSVILMIFTSALAENFPEIDFKWPNGLKSPNPAEAKFRFTYRILMLAVASLVSYMFIKFVNNHNFDTFIDRCKRTIVYLAATICLGDLILDRLDVVVGAILICALYMLMNGNYIYSFLLIAIGINYKVVPIVVMPLFIIGSLSGIIYQLPVKKMIKAILIRSFIMIFLTAIIFLPFYLCVGQKSLTFFEYNRLRGIEFESSYAGLNCIINYLFGLEIHYIFKFGSTDSETWLSPTYLLIAPVLLLLSILYSNYKFISCARSSLYDLRSSHRPICSLHTSEFIDNVIFCLISFILFNKVLSPQYLLWLVPLVPLISLKGFRLSIFLVIFLGVCFTTYLVSVRWFDHMIGIGNRLPYSEHSGPSIVGQRILITRTLILLFLYVCSLLRIKYASR